MSLMWLKTWAGHDSLRYSRVEPRRRRHPDREVLDIIYEIDRLKGIESWPWTYHRKVIHFLDDLYWENYDCHPLYKLPNKREIAFM